ncbi:MAG TPA: type 4 pilus major pilin [Noviherbaspirillum sp.]
MQRTYNVDLHKAARFSRQDGASLLEGIAYLGIAAIVVLGAVSLLTGAFGSARANQTSEEIVAMRTAVRKLYSGQPYGNAALTANLIAANAIPNTLTRNGNVVTNSWGGAVTATGTGTQFTITYNAVPRDVCVAVISGASGWVRIQAGGPAVDVFPATVQAATGTCTNANANNITFTST